MKKLLFFLLVGLISFVSYAYCSLSGTFTSSHGDVYAFKITDPSAGTDCSRAYAKLAQLQREAY